jgi:DNA-binding PadR family transcriptional regulator
MSVKHALLGILAESPAHGYELKNRFEERLGEVWTLNFGQIYTTLERLEQEGLVEYESIAQDDKPDKKHYWITEEGRKAFEEWRRAPIKAEPRVLRDELFLKLVFLRHNDSGSIMRVIQSQQSVYMAHMMQLTNRKFEIEESAQRAIEECSDENERAQLEQEKVISTLLIDVALYHAEADIRWLRHCEARLKEFVSP